MKKGKSTSLFPFLFYFYFMKLPRRLKYFIVLVVFFIVLLSCSKPALIRLSDFLTKSEKVEANVLIIEGWLSYNDLEYAMNEFSTGSYEYIFTTGLKSTREYYNVNTDGFLIFYTGGKSPKPVRSVAVRASSELDGKHAAHFKVWVNDIVVAGYHADKRRRLYSAPWNGSPVDSVMIEFDNDVMGEFGDRNLFVKEIILNGDTRIPFLNNSVYDISELDNRNRIINNMTSNSELTAKRLLSMGIDTARVVAIPGERVRVNRTLTSAIAVRDWLTKNDLDIKGINILSSGTHSRRTWMTFDRILPESVNVGIIALPDSKENKTEGIRYMKTARETIAYIYYWLMLMLY